MYCCSRPVARASPSVYRAVRNASFFPGPLVARAASHHGDFAPFLRMLDDITAPLAPAYAQHARHAFAGFGFPNAPSFNPSFDVKEVGSTYELTGEVPGFEGSDIEVEFADAQTLVIRGSTDKVTSSGQPPVDAAKAVADTAPAETQTPETEKDIDDNASTYSTGSYQKPSVEEGETDAAQAPADSQAQAESAVTTAPQEQDVSQSKPQQAQSQYWFKERRTGSFQRVFKFESRVDQDAVTASLKNGILNITVPKAAAPAARRINVE